MKEPYKFKHTKRYARTGSGVALMCGERMVSSLPHRLGNFKWDCPFCGINVVTFGDSPDTDMIRETNYDDLVAHQTKECKSSKEKSLICLR